MDSLSFYFVADVVAHLESMEDVKKLGGVWSAAAQEEAESRITCSLNLSSRRNGGERAIYYEFMCNPGGIMSFKEVKKLNLRRLRISSIILSEQCTYNIEKELLPELLSFANSYLTYLQRFTIRSHEDVDENGHDHSMVQSIHSLKNIREIVLWYRDFTARGFFDFRSFTHRYQFLRQVLSTARTEVLLLKGGWSLRILDILMEGWEKSSVRDIYIDDASNSTCHTLQCDVLKKIYQFWVDGFFVTRSLDAVFLLQDDLSALAITFGRPSGNLLTNKWCFRHPSHGTFQLVTHRNSKLSYPYLRILIA
uniref:FBA_2 domain-containing protein n=1 Tax=Steinernema glaseri TaxID=37863 RepID=A0A1I7Y6Y5_9BILA